MDLEVCLALIVATLYALHAIHKEQDKTKDAQEREREAWRLLHEQRKLDEQRERRERLAIKHADRLERIARIRDAQGIEWEWPDWANRS